MAKSKLSDPEVRAEVIATLQKMKAESKAYHVISSRGNWVVVGENGTRRSRKRFEDQGHAIEYARDLAQKSHFDLVIHRRDGGVRERMSFRDSGAPKKQPS